MGYWGLGFDWFGFDCRSGSGSGFLLSNLGLDCGCGLSLWWRGIGSGLDGDEGEEEGWSADAVVGEGLAGSVNEGFVGHGELYRMRNAECGDASVNEERKAV